MKNLKKKDFITIWKDSTKENILNQFYYEHMQLQRLLELCDKYEKEHDTTFKEWQKDIQANKKAIELLELKQLRYLNENDYKICTLDLQEVKDILRNGSNENE